LVYISDNISQTLTMGAYFILLNIFMIYYNLTT